MDFICVLSLFSKLAQVGERPIPISIGLIIPKTVFELTIFPSTPWEAALPVSKPLTVIIEYFSFLKHPVYKEGNMLSQNCSAK